MPTYTWDERELARLDAQASQTWAILQPHLRAAGLRPGATVLDLGCGPGRLAVRLADAVGASGHVIGIDHDAALLAHAAEAPGGDGELTWQVGDATELELDDASVDLVVAHMLFQHLGDPLSAAREIARVLRPGGAVVLTDVDDGLLDVRPMPSGLGSFLTRTTAAQADAGGDRHVGHRLGGMLHAAGLVRVESHVATVTSEQLGLDLLWGLAVDFRRHLETTDHRDGLDERLATWRQGLGDRGWIAVGVVSAIGRRP